MGIENLSKVKEKEEILKTQGADVLIKSPEEVEDYYKLHIHTHVDIGGIEGYKKRFFDKLEKKIPVLGAVIARYGFGKTSTLIRWWYECEQKRYFAIPPFNFNYLQDIAKATYGWLMYRFRSLGRNDLCIELEDSYKKIAKKISEHVEEEYRLTEEQVTRMLGDGILRPELAAQDLREFLEICTNLVLRCGYKGLAIFADEFQRVPLANKDRDIKRLLQKFRDFIDGIKTRDKMPLAFIVAIPQELIPSLEERRHDIIDRLKADQMCIDFQNVFDRNFPSTLWNKMSKELDFFDERYEIISQDCLDSLGQILMLSGFFAGPRTVIKAFKLASDHCMKSDSSYGIEKLVDDLTNDVNPYISSDYSSIVKKAMELPEINDDDKKRVLKILAAFPEGVTEEYFEDLGLGRTFTELHKRFMGEYIRWSTSGYSLPFMSERISRDEELLKEFWRVYDSFDTSTDEIAMETFANRVISLLFKAKSGQLKSWAGAKQFLTNGDPIRGYIGKLTGTFSESFPKREIMIRLINDEKQVYNDTSLVDFEIVFVLGEESFFKIKDRTIVIGLEKSKSYAKEKIPPSLKSLSKRFLPKEITPKLLLNLVDYIEKSDVESPSLDYKKKEYISKAILMLFNEDLRHEAQKSEIQTKNLGNQMLEEIFFGICKKLWPKYLTIMNSPHWQSSYISRYKEVLERLDTPDRREGAILEGKKREIVGEIFGHTSGSYSSFEPRMKEYKKMGLLNVIEFSGDQIEGSVVVEILEHPLEKRIREMLRGKRSLSLENIEKMGRELGYRDEELNEIVELLFRRRYVIFSEDSKFLIPYEPATPQNVKQEIDQLMEHMQLLKPYIADKSYEEITESLEELEEELREAISPDIIEDIYFRSLPDKRSQISILINENISSRKEAIRKKEGELKSAYRDLIPQALEIKTSSTVGFVQHLEDCRIELRRGYQSLPIKDILDRTARFLDGIENIEADEVEQVVQFFEQYKELTEQSEIFEKQKSAIDEFRVLYGIWCKSNLKSIEALRDKLHGTSLQSDIDSLIDEIQMRFTQDKLEALRSVEAYESKIEKLKKRKDEIEMERRKHWEEEKEKYESILRKGDLEKLLDDRIIHERFDSQQEKENYEALVRSSAEKIKVIINKILKKVKRLQHDTRLFEIKNREKLSNINQEINRIKNEIQLIYEKEEEFKQRRNPESFEDLVDTVVNTDVLIQETTKILNEKKKPGIPNEEEKEILNYISEKDSIIDFVEILTKIGEIRKIEDPSDLFEEGSSMLMKLYKKELIRISISRRK